MFLSDINDKSTKTNLLFLHIPILQRAFLDIEIGERQSFSKCLRDTALRLSHLHVLVAALNDADDETTFLRRIGYREKVKFDVNRLQSTNNPLHFFFFFTKEVKS